MKILKDLLYTKDNGALEIARVSSLFSVISYWSCVFWHMWRTGDFDPAAVGAGCAALFAGAAGWIFARQKHERSAHVSDT